MNPSGAFMPLSAAPVSPAVNSFLEKGDATNVGVGSNAKPCIQTLPDMHRLAAELGFAEYFMAHFDKASLPATHPKPPESREATTPLMVLCYMWRGHGYARVYQDTC